MTDRELEVKKLLFGNQKQANVINDAVATIVCRTFYNLPPEDRAGNDLNEQMYAAIQATVSFITSGEKVSPDGRTFIMLTCGADALALLSSGTPYIVNMWQPSIESPKWNFRIAPLGVNEQVEEESHDESAPVGKPLVGPDEVYSDNDSLAQRVEKIKNAIVPMAPQSAMAELGNDEYKVALCYAEYFYGYGK